MTTPEEPADRAAEPRSGPRATANDATALPTQRTTDSADGAR